MKNQSCAVALTVVSLGAPESPGNVLARARAANDNETARSPRQARPISRVIPSPRLPVARTDMPPLPSLPFDILPWVVISAMAGPRVLSLLQAALANPAIAASLAP